MNSNLLYLYSNSFLCCKKKDNLDKKLTILFNILENLDNLTIKDKNLILSRYIPLIRYIRNKYISYSKYYTFSSLFIIISSILITLLTPIINSNSTYHTILVYIISILSFLISITNGLSTFFKWDRKYILLFKIYNKVEQEIWLFIESVGIYKLQENETYKHKLSLFLNKIEIYNKRLSDNLLELELKDDLNNSNNNPNNNNINNINNTNTNSTNIQPVRSDLEFVQSITSPDNNISFYERKKQDIKIEINEVLKEDIKEDIKEEIKEEIKI